MKEQLAMIDQEYIEAKYNCDRIMEAGRLRVHRTSNKVGMGANISLYEFDFHAATRKELYEKITDLFDKTYNGMLARAKGRHPDREPEGDDFDNFVISFDYDGSNELTLHGQLLLKVDDDEIYRRGSEGLIQEEKDALKKYINNTKKAERKRLREEIDLKRLIEKHPELASKLLTSGDS